MPIIVKSADGLIQAKVPTMADVKSGGDTPSSVGDMTKAVYDPTLKAQDIFAYADSKASSAQSSAISAAAADATTKANTAEANAKAASRPVSWTPTKADVGLGNVDNTSDANKPISTATQTALNGKVDNSRVLTDVPAGAIFTDTVTTINGKTGTIAKSDIVALGIPAQDTVYTHPSAHSADIIVDGTTNKTYTAAEKTKLAGIATGANNYTHPSTHSADIIIDGTSNKAYTAAEKTKLAGLSSYTLPIASASTLGGVKVGSNLAIDANGVLSASSAPTPPVNSVFGRTGAVTAQTGDYTAAQVGAIAASLKGAANGVAELDSSGKVPEAQLPSMGGGVTAVSATLSTSWAGSAAPYTQTVTVSGITPSTPSIIGLAETATVAQEKAASLANLKVSAGTNTVTVTARGIKPTTTIPIVVMIMG